MVDSTSPERAAMYSSTRLQIGLFGPNCSSGRAVTMVPERWSGSWEDNLKIARMADDGGHGRRACHSYSAGWQTLPVRLIKWRVLKPLGASGRRASQVSGVRKVSVP